jgi:hypothetical protein
MPVIRLMPHKRAVIKYESTHKDHNAGCKIAIESIAILLINGLSYSLVKNKKYLAVANVKSAWAAETEIMRNYSRLAAL